MKKVRTVFHLDEADREALERISKKSGAPLAELIRRAVSDFLKKQK
jgi:hypothetical protein